MQMFKDGYLLWVTVLKKEGNGGEIEGNMQNEWISDRLTKE